MASTDAPMSGQSRRAAAASTSAASTSADAGEGGVKGDEGSRNRDTNDKDAAGEAGEGGGEAGEARRRLKKWRRMLGATLGDWKEYVRAKPQVVQRRVRQGIPDSLRGYAWQAGTALGRTPNVWFTCCAARKPARGWAPLPNVHLPAALRALRASRGV